MTKMFHSFTNTNSSPLRNRCSQIRFSRAWAFEFHASESKESTDSKRSTDTHFPLRSPCNFERKAESRLLFFFFNQNHKGIYAQNMICAENMTLALVPPVEAPHGETGMPERWPSPPVQASPHISQAGPLKAKHVKACHLLLLFYHKRGYHDCEEFWCKNRWINRRAFMAQNRGFKISHKTRT